MPGNKNVQDSRRNKQDEFYTSLSIIENELKHYKNHFKNKIVLCNCDDPRVSNFFRYFVMYFEVLELKKLIATCYKNNDANIFTEESSDNAVYLEYDGKIKYTCENDFSKIPCKNLKGNGDYKTVLKDVTVSNGICWSLDGNKMYYQDSPLRTISAFDFNLNKCTISEREEVVKIPKDMGTPDGNTMDATGMVWMANWGGACVSKWNPHTGQMLQKVDIPAYNVTSVAFGGENLEDLYITTASKYMPEDKESLYPDAGKLFVCKPGCKGIKANYFSK